MVGIKVGVTGSRHGLTDPQAKVLCDLMAGTMPSEFHHGDCQGVDEYAFWTGFKLGAVGLFHAWPADESVERWWANTCRYADIISMVVHDRMPPLERNRRIVDSVDVMWAFPAEQTEQSKGGTWYTVRYARTRPVKLLVVLPDGTIV